jgi:nucleotide-binding universal stress UspA family protein
MTSSSLRQLLVHLDPTRAAGQRLAVARQLAAQHGAALAALYAGTPSFVGLPWSPEMAPEAAALLVEIDEQRRAEALRAFDQALAAPGPLALWAETGAVPVAVAFAEQAVFADLLVLGQPDPADPQASAVPPDFIFSVLSASGRPALVVPHIGTTGAIGERVAIAWKPTREAARAVAGALPLLQRASEVHVLAWGEEEAPEITGNRLDLEGYLRLHGLHPRWHRAGPEPQSQSMGELLLSAAFDVSADLLVMGCYGHSRAREWVLGGASRTVLESMTLPVLMAH